MEALQFPGNFEDLDELRKYKKQICIQYPDRNVVVYDYRYKYPIVHSIENNKSRMGFYGTMWGSAASRMLGKNNQLMEYPFAPKWNKIIHITNDPILENVDIPVNCCKFPTLWVKEAIELGTTIQRVYSKISWNTHPDYSQPHLLKGLGVSAKNFRILYKTTYMDLAVFKRLISFGIPEKDIFACDKIANYITTDFDSDCIKYAITQCSDTHKFCIYSYRDYLRMRKDLPSAIKRQWPKCPNLKKYRSVEWHNKLMRAYNNLQNEIAAEKDRVQQSKYFEKVYPKAKEFELVDEVYSVICPEQITSLLLEGRTLHHCVGSYINSVAGGNEYILFLRKTDDIDTPFFTINILPNKKVRQI
ncbi:MAG: PcfJ domain-containing protein, partial [Paludibacteraceae bacterium]|nr:PcfJ domain-containing protein [Paludibacteraceae bacterium]